MEGACRFSSGDLNQKVSFSSFKSSFSKLSSCSSHATCMFFELIRFSIHYPSALSRRSASRPTGKLAVYCLAGFSCKHGVIPIRSVEMTPLLWGAAHACQRVKAQNPVQSFTIAPKAFLSSSLSPAGTSCADAYDTPNFNWVLLKSAILWTYAP